MAGEGILITGVEDRLRAVEAFFDEAERGAAAGERRPDAA